jgi:hypothetical protein
VAISDPATAKFIAIKNMGNTSIAHKPRHTQTYTHPETLEAREKPRWQLVTQLLTDQNTQVEPKYQYKYTQTHNGTQTKSLIEITTQRLGNWFCFRHQVKTSEGDLFSINCLGPGSDHGTYWRKSAITIAGNTKQYKA